jgi:hypothetical protein
MTNSVVVSDVAAANFAQNDKFSGGIRRGCSELRSG